VRQHDHDLGRQRAPEAGRQPGVGLLAQCGQDLGPLSVGRVVEHGEVAGPLLGDRPVVPEVPGRRQADVLDVAVGDDPPPPVPEEECVVVAVDSVDGVDPGEAVVGLHRRQEHTVGAGVAAGEPATGQVRHLVGPQP